MEGFSFACTMCHCQGHSRVAPAGFLPLHVDECSSIQPLSLLSAVACVETISMEATVSRCCFFYLWAKREILVLD